MVSFKCYIQLQRYWERAARIRDQYLEQQLKGATTIDNMTSNVQASQLGALRPHYSHETAFSAGRYHPLNQQASHSSPSLHILNGF